MGEHSVWMTFIYNHNRNSTLINYSLIQQSIIPSSFESTKNFLYLPLGEGGFHNPKRVVINVKKEFIIVKFLVLNLHYELKKLE